MRTCRSRIAALILPLVLIGCEGASQQSMVHPAGESAREIAWLGAFMWVLGGLVYLIVMGLLGWSLMRRRRQDGGEREASTGLWLGVGGALIPLGILMLVFAVTLYVMRREANAERMEGPLTIQVVAHKWWWEVHYQHPVAARRVQTANEIRVPVGQPVLVQLRSRDVIHSFWVPNLHPKVDMIPGRRNELWFRAERAGVYRGQCGEYCGLQHANMAFVVVALPPEDYRAWYEAQLDPGVEPLTELARRGREVFLQRDCSLCHAVRGTMALGRAGPDLTHIASRLTLAAGTLPNTRGHLGGWISNPQQIKPGSYMPNVDLTSEELIALVAYMETLR